jgi:peptidoglycan hydrolase-like protein with peptidoglycan-binding domain
VGAAPIFLLAQTPPPKKQTSPIKKSSKTSKKRLARPPAQRAPTADRIREIQTALAQKGYYAGDPSGKWDARSVEAMKRFQAANGLTQTGKFDAKSLQKLGLGSEIAGAAPPRKLADPNKPQLPRP